MMLARTVPIPKKEVLTPENCRPITILATLYRLWGKVCARRCLQHFAQLMPRSITGMLPARGALTATYIMQTLLETQRKTDVNITGLTLDLRKCFNLLNRSKVQLLLHALGIPMKLVQK